MSLWISTLVALLLLWGLLAALQFVVRRGGSLAAVTEVMVAEVWRRRFLPIAGLILITGLVCLPFILGVDSVDPDDRRTLLQYGQGWTGLVTLASILVMGCSTLADERSSGRLGYLSLRPGLSYRWLPGKWLGMICSAIILLIPATWLLISQITDSEGRWDNPSTILPVSADQFSVTAEDVEFYLLLKLEESPLEWGQYSEEEGRARARQLLQREARSIALGATAYLDFTLPEGEGLESDSADSMRLSLRPALGKAHRSRVARLRVSGEDFSRDLLVTNGQRISVEIPSRLIRNDKLSLEVEFLGAVAEEVVIPSLYWIDRNAVELQVPKGTFAGSLIRSQLLLLARSAFVAALSLAVSTFLGFPVATLLVFCFLLAATGGGFVGAFEETGPQTMVDPRQESDSRRVIDLLALGGEKIVHSLHDWKLSSRSEQVSAGEYIAGQEVWWGVFRLAGVWSSLALLLGSFLLSNQEKSTGDDR